MKKQDFMKKFLKGYKKMRKDIGVLFRSCKVDEEKCRRKKKGGYVGTKRMDLKYKYKAMGMTLVKLLNHSKHHPQLGFLSSSYETLLDFG
jgi:hypothetical protein